MESPLDFVKSMGWEYKIIGDQINIKECPICHLSDWKFYMNIHNGLWDCKHANHHNEDNKAGNLYKLKKLLGLTCEITKASSSGKNIKPLDEKFEEYVIKAHNKLINTEYLLQILLDEWKINKRIVKMFKLGYVEENGKAFLTIPHYLDVTGGTNYKLYDIKKRVWFGEAIDEGKYRRVAGASSVLFRETILHRSSIKEVIVCEGEKDAIILTACGYRNVIGLTKGASGFDDRWIELLEKAEKIILALDNDEAGQKGTEKLLDRLGRHRCYLIELPPTYDIADYYIQFGKEGIKRLINNAKQPEIPSISTPKDLLEDILFRDEGKAEPLYLKHFTKLLNGGFREGQLITLTGLPKIGKTTLSLSLAVDFARRGIPTLFYCMEMPADIIYTMATGMYFGIGRKVNKVDLINFVNLDLPFYFGYKGDLTIKQLENTFRDAYYRYGCKFFVFDNIQYMSRNIPKNSNKVEFIENVYKTLKLLSIELKAFIIAIAQPKKIDIKKADNMNYFDIAWTGSAASDSDTIIIVHRERSSEAESSFVPEMQIKIDAGRYTKGGRSTILYLENDMLFAESSFGTEDD